MLNPNFFNTLFVIPILNVLMSFYKVFSLANLPGALGWSMIGLTVLVRLLLHPFFKKQLETAKKMADIKPHLDKLSARHKKDPKKLQEEQMKLYQRVGINPASGCLFLIIQMPIFIALYQTLSLFLTNGNLNKVIIAINKVVYSPMLKIQSIDPWFFGFNLGLSPAKSGGLWFYYLIPIITGVLQYFQAQTTGMSTPSTSAGDVKDGSSSAKATEDKGDFQKAMSMQMKYIFPFMIAYFSYTLPVGLSLYWNIFSIFSIIQYQKINPKSKILNSK